MKLKKLKASSIFIFLIVLYCFYTYDLRPYFFWNTYNSGIFGFINRLPMRSIIGLLVIMFGLICVNNKQNKGIVFYAIVILLVVGTSLVKSNAYILSPNWLIPIATTMFVMSSERIKEQSYVYFYNVFLIFLVFPIMIYTLVHVGINVPYTILESHEDIKQATRIFYKIYPLACQWSDPWNDMYRALRMCGVYSEPGVVGTFCAMLLCGEDFQFKKNWKNIIILFGGIFSFSLAFYIVLFVYILWRAVNKNWKYVATIFLIVLIYVLFVNIKFDNPVIANFQSRLVITSTGLSGNNRTNFRYDSIFNSLGNDGLFSAIFGKGFGAIEDVLSANSIDGASYKNLIYNYGIVGFLIQIVWYISISFFITNGKNKQYRRFCLGMCLIMCANMYQRPTMFGFQYLVVMLGADYCHMKGIQASNQHILTLGRKKDNRLIG